MNVPHSCTPRQRKHGAAGADFRDAGAVKTEAGLMAQDATAEAQRSNWSFADDYRLVSVFTGHADGIVPTYADDFELSMAAPLVLDSAVLTEAAAMFS